MNSTSNDYHFSHPGITNKWIQHDPESYYRIKYARVESCINYRHFENEEKCMKHTEDGSSHEYLLGFFTGVLVNNAWLGPNPVPSGAGIMLQKGTETGVVLDEITHETIKDLEIVVIDANVNGIYGKPLSVIHKHDSRIHDSIIVYDHLFFNISIPCNDRAWYTIWIAINASTTFGDLFLELQKQLRTFAETYKTKHCENTDCPRQKLFEDLGDLIFGGITKYDQEQWGLVLFSKDNRERAKECLRPDLIEFPTITPY